jgi:hypothetical protein
VEARIARLRLLPHGNYSTSSSDEEPTAKPRLPQGNYSTSSSEEEEEPPPKPAVRSPVVGDRVLVAPDSDSPFKGQEVRVTAKEGGRVLFSAGRKKGGVVRQEVELHPDVIAGEEAIDRFGIKPNDIFVTPAVAHRIMSEHVGWDTADPAKDPCHMESLP